MTISGTDVVTDSHQGSNILFIRRNELALFAIESLTFSWFLISYPTFNSKITTSCYRISVSYDAGERYLNSSCRASCCTSKGY